MRAEWRGRDAALTLLRQHWGSGEKGRERASERETRVDSVFKVKIIPAARAIKITPGKRLGRWRIIKQSTGKWRFHAWDTALAAPRVHVRIWSRIWVWRRFSCVTERVRAAECAKRYIGTGSVHCVWLVYLSFAGDSQVSLRDWGDGKASDLINTTGSFHLGAQLAIRHSLV